MPKIIKKTLKKKTETTKKSPVSKVKKPVASKTKKVVKKTKTIKAAEPVKSKKIAVDVIADDNFLDSEEINDSLPSFSSWPNLEKQTDDSFPKMSNFKTEAIESPEEESETEDVEDEQYDKQKKFFAEWANSVAPQAGEEKPKLAPGKSLGLYRRMAVKFIIATAVLLVCIFYFFFSKLTISITPQSELINDSFSFIVGSNSTSTEEVDASAEKKILGVVKEITVTAEKTYPTSGEEVIGGETVNGQVTIINKYNKAQPLVVKTRLLSPDGKQFRIKNSVNVPAGGEVVVDIYADEPSAESALAANTRFTIPGLWAGLQNQIYAENKQDFSYQTEVKHTLQQKDIDLANKDILDVLNLKAKSEIENADQNNIMVYGDVADSLINNIDAKLGEEKAQFTATASKKVVVVTFSKEEVAKMAEARLSLLVPDDKQLADFDGNQITYNLEDYNADSQLATIKAYFGSSMFLKSDSSLLDRKKMVGLNRKQISQYLDSFPEIKSYELKFSPSFISSAPNLPHKIKVEVKNVE
jgi:hypothetical protein